MTVEIPVRKPEILVGGLNAATAYEFHVRAVSDVGQSLSATHVVVITNPAG